MHWVFALLSCGAHIYLFVFSPQAAATKLEEHGYIGCLCMHYTSVLDLSHALGAECANPYTHAPQSFGKHSHKCETTAKRKLNLQCDIQQGCDGQVSTNFSASKN